VLLLRAMDVPARLATGYIEPEELTEGHVTTGGSTLGNRMMDSYDADSVREGFASRRANARTSAMSFSLREKDAHAWVEYFIPGAGWMTYDPTAGTRTTELPIEDQIASFLSLPSLQFKWSTLWLPLCGLLLVVTGVAWSMYDYRQRQNFVPQTATDLTRAHIVAAYNQAVRLLRRHVPPATHLTPREYEAAVSSAPIPQPAKQEFSALTYLLIAARYSDDPPAMSRPDLDASIARLHRALRSK
jgi:transglutaminase-like putative cysteine protease